MKAVLPSVLIVPAAGQKLITKEIYDKFDIKKIRMNVFTIIQPVSVPDKYRLFSFLISIKIYTVDSDKNCLNVKISLMRP